MQVWDALARVEQVLIPARVPIANAASSSPSTVAAIDSGATLLTFDKNFDRIAGLDHITLSAPPRTV